MAMRLGPNWTHAMRVNFVPVLYCPHQFPKAMDAIPQPQNHQCGAAPDSTACWNTGETDGQNFYQVRQEKCVNDSVICFFRTVLYIIFVRSHFASATLGRVIEVGWTRHASQRNVSQRFWSFYRFWTFEAGGSLGSTLVANRMSMALINEQYAYESAELNWPSPRSQTLNFLIYDRWWGMDSETPGCIYIIAVAF